MGRRGRVETLRPLGFCRRNVRAGDLFHGCENRDQTDEAAREWAATAIETADKFYVIDQLEYASVCKTIRWQTFEWIKGVLIASMA